LYVLDARKLKIQADTGNRRKWAHHLGRSDLCR